jgi:phospholipid/cholesterol/gamma-HCH transport system substrate-binding protein
MDDKVNYTVVGAFVLVLGALLVAAVLWLSAGIGGRQEVDAYQAYIEESVAGLNTDAPVKYLGVDVGRVSHIEIDPANSQQVRLRFEIRRGTPIKRDSEAVLKTQGLTGIAYVELSGGSASAPALRSDDADTLPTIPFKPSLAARLENVLGTVLANIDRLTTSLDAVFDADNRSALKAGLADTAQLARALASQQAVVKAGIADAARTARLTAEASAQLAPTLARIASSAEAVERLAKTAETASRDAGRAASAAASSVQRAGAETLPELSRLLGELNQLSVSLRRLSEQTEGNPSSLLVGRPAPRLGPGERPPR